jgi:hypothetical protein
VPRLKIVPSPSTDVCLTPYDPATFPKFQQIFDANKFSPLYHFARPAEEASVTLVLENRSVKAITGLAYRWTALDQSGHSQARTCFSDSYMVDVYRAVAEPGSRHLVSPSTMLDEALIEHVLAGGGYIRAGVRDRSADSFLEMTFEIDLVLFADGEICGSDPDRQAIQLRCRKPAAEFVANQIRRAMEEHRDVEPVLSALAEIPCLGSLHHLGRGMGDPRVLWIKHYAKDYLTHAKRKDDRINWAEVRLRHLENRPALPKFYRRQE